MVVGEQSQPLLQAAQGGIEVGEQRILEAPAAASGGLWPYMWRELR